MKTVIIGAGPTGLFTGIGLARRGREVVVVDRDPGPPQYGEWRRRGVMQFRHAHSFRGQVVEALQAELPDVLDGLLSAGATVAVSDAHGGRPAALHCRRSVFERALWQRASTQPGLHLVAAHADEILVERDRATGVRIAGRRLDAELVIDASGRASRITRQVRGRGEGGDCGATYAGRLYRMRTGMTPGPINSVIGLSLSFPEYAAVAFLHDNATFTVTLIHSGADERLHRLRHDDVFDAAVRAIPGLAEWISPERALPIAPTLAGGRLHNYYRGQLDKAGRPLLRGLLAVGDSVCTTTPLAGRGVALAFSQARELLGLLTRGTPDIDDLTIEFDNWCTQYIRPWFTDHRYADTERVRRWSGYDVDLDRPLPSDLIVAAAATDPDLADMVAAYVTMDALPASLEPAEVRARDIFAAGWRPPPPIGPTLDELTSVVSRTPVAA